MFSRYTKSPHKWLPIIMVFLAAFLSIVTVIAISKIAAYAADDPQVDYGGSATWQTGEGDFGFRQLMTQTKDASGNYIENTFDVEVDVRTKTDISYKDVNICLVLDLSRSMVSNKVGEGDTQTTRLGALAWSAERLIDKYIEQSKNIPGTDVEGGVERLLTIVGFNTSAHILLKPTDVRKESSENIYSEFEEALLEAISDYARYDEATDQFIDATDAAWSPERFTNCESGLRTAQNIVNASLAGKEDPSKNILFLSDGLPTTYSVVHDHNLKPSGESTIDYDKRGFYPYMSDSVSPNVGKHTNPDWRQPCWYLEGNISQYDLLPGQDGRFWNLKLNQESTSATNYSDKGALYTHERASAMRADGYKIYSVGIGIDKQTLPDDYTTQSTIDCFSEPFHGKKYVTCNTRDEFELWLAGNDSRDGYGAYGVGSYGLVEKSYWPVSDSDGEDALVEAFNTILQNMVFSTEAWQASIDIGVDDKTSSTSKYSDFISFYERNLNTEQWDLTTNHNASVGKHVNNTQGRNSAKFENKAGGVSSNAGRITWDLSNSGYEIDADEYYVYKMKYRIRINNLYDNFSAWEGSPVKANTAISVDYQIYDNYGQVNPIMKTFNQSTESIPTFHALKGDSDMFTKMDLVTREKLAGVSFKLVHMHDASKVTLQDHYCDQCFNNKTAAADNAVYCTATTSSEEGHEGEITFEDIPSGHSYQLVEEDGPEGYYFPYDIMVTVDFGVVKFMEKKGTSKKEITEEIYNNPTSVMKIYAPGTAVTSEETMVAPDFEGMPDTIQYVIYWQNEAPESTDDTVVVTDTLTKGLEFESQVEPDAPKPVVTKDASTGLQTLTWTMNNTKYLDAGIFNYKCKVTSDCYNQGTVTNSAYQQIGDNPQTIIGILSNPVPNKEPDPEYINGTQTGDIPAWAYISLLIIGLSASAVLLRKLFN